MKVRYRVMVGRVELVSRHPEYRYTRAGYQATLG